LLSHPAVLVT